MGLTIVSLSWQLEVDIAQTHNTFKIQNSLPLPQEISDLDASKSFPDLLLEGLCPNLRKTSTFAKPQSRCPPRSLRNKHPKGVGVSAVCSAIKHAPLLTCLYFTAKGLLEKYTRALSQSATVCTGIKATVTVSVQLRKEWEPGGGWSWDATETGSDHNKHNLLQGANPTLQTWLGFLVRDLTRKEGKREKNEGAFFVLLP